MKANLLALHLALDIGGGGAVPAHVAYGPQFVQMFGKHAWQESRFPTYPSPTERVDS